MTREPPATDAPAEHVSSVEPRDPLGMPAAEVEISAGLVRRLLELQHPDLAALEIKFLANGWDNALYRLGDSMMARLPRRAMAAPLVAHELRWLPELAQHLPLPIPVALRAGRPNRHYPYEWAVVPFFEGEPVGTGGFTDPGASADLLGRFVGSLHRKASPDAPVNPYRGQPLAERDVITTRRLVSAEGVLAEGGILSRDVGRAWAESLAADPWPGPPMWLHGDLHPMNILAERGRLSAVIDFGDITSGDPATDLMVAWYLFDEAGRDVFRQSAGAAGGAVDDSTWERGRGWVLSHALAIMVNSADAPVMRSVGFRGLRSALSV